MATNQSSWKVGQWTTPTTTVTTQPVPSEVTAESRSQISHNIPGQFAAFIQEEYPTFVEFVKAYYKSQELRGYCFDIICLLYTSPSPRDRQKSRMPSSA